MTLARHAAEPVAHALAPERVAALRWRPMHRSVLVRQVAPSALAFVALLPAAVALDAAMHRIGLGAAGFWLGPIGVALIAISYAYSFQRRSGVRVVPMPSVLRLHEWTGWTGTLCVLVHSGAHFNAWLPWLAAAAMLTVVASGITGAWLLRRAIETLRAERADANADPGRLMLDAATVDVMKRWRSVHLPIHAVFVVLALLHVASVLVLRKG